MEQKVLGKSDCGPKLAIADHSKFVSFLENVSINTWNKHAE